MATAVSNALESALRSVMADGRVTASEWSTVLAPIAEQTPQRASPAVHPLIDLWLIEDVIVETGARNGLARFLQSRGYAATPRPGGFPSEPSPAPVGTKEALLAGNMGEPDLELARLGAAVGRTATQTIIAVLDSGFKASRLSLFDETHPLLEGKLWTNAGEVADNGLDDDGNGLVDDVHGWDFGQNDAGLTGMSHGLHVTGIATRGTDRIDAIQLKVLDVFGAQVAVNAIEYAVEHGARVLNLSFLIKGGPELIRPILDAMARHPDVLFVKSAGNEGATLGTREWTGDRYLSANVLPNLIVVAGEDQGELAPQSNRGVPYVTHAAHAVEFSSDDLVLYSEGGGTSQATPNVTAAAAKCLLLEPTLSAVQVKALLSVTSDLRPDWASHVVAGGPINPVRAMRLAALVALRKQGLSAHSAADRLALPPEERERLVAASNELV
jgi:subtilisin family serine protease